MKDEGPYRARGEAGAPRRRSYVIRPTSGWFDLHLSDLWRYRDLVLLFVHRDFVAVYKQTVLGPLWYLVQPVLTTIVFVVIFGNLAGIPTDGIPHALFYLSGLTVWGYFSGCLNKTANTFVGNSHLFGKVYFPRLAVPVSVVISGLISFAIQFVLFLGVLIYYLVQGSSFVPRLHLLALVPLLILQIAALGLGFGIIVSSLTTKYRDLTFLVSFGVQLWMYGTPIVYPVSKIPEQWIWLFSLNPMTAVIESFRYIFLGLDSLQPWQVAFSVASTVLVLLLGLVLFSRVEKSFMDTV